MKQNKAFTLAEGASHGAFFTNKHRSAFTLAEVLITLGIIGIVAAMTLPALIGKYQKVQTTTRLKKAYTTMAQALTRAQSDYGDTNLWENLSIDAESNEGNIIVAKQVEKYILPYLKNVLSSGLSSLDEKGYTIYYTANGNTNTNLAADSKKFYIIEMADSTTFFFERESSGYLIIYFDINGIKQNNIWGKDAFIFYIEPQLGKFVPLGYKSDRTSLLNACKSEGKVCAALIIQDGWEIKNDYPIKF